MSDEFEAFPMSALYLPGTVALPSPFPTAGKVWLPSPDFECMPGLLKGHDLHLLAIGSLVPPSRSIVRYVRVEHISAVFLLVGTSDAEDSEAVNWKQGEWLYRAEPRTFERQIEGEKPGDRLRPRARTRNDSVGIRHDGRRKCRIHPSLQNLLIDGSLQKPLGEGDGPRFCSALAGDGPGGFVRASGAETWRLKSILSF